MFFNHRPTFIKQVAALGLLASTMSAQAMEYPIGTPQQRFGMEIGAVYLQPVVMEPEGMMKKAEESDIHIEADIKALAGNPNGFEEGAWVPYLVVKFEVTKTGTNQKVKVSSCPWWPTTARTMATTSSCSAPASTTSSTPSCRRQREQARALWPPHRPPDRRAPLVQAL